MNIDPVCVFHGKRRSEHVCLVCTLCFKDLKPEECSYLLDGNQVDVCIPCAEAEQEYMIKLTQERMAELTRERYELREPWWPEVLRAES